MQTPKNLFLKVSAFFLLFLPVSLPSLPPLFSRVQSLQERGGNVCKLKIWVSLVFFNHGTPEVLFSSYVCFAFKEMHSSDGMNGKERQVEWKYQEMDSE